MQGIRQAVEHLGGDAGIVEGVVGVIGAFGCC
jgi:hypothetical protein